MNQKKEKVVPVLSKESATNYIYLYSAGYSPLERLMLIQKTLNDIEERLTRIEERLDK